jgi:hypothetical protein
MKIPKKIICILLLLVVCVLFGVVDYYFANIVYRAYEPVVKGILGIAIFYLVFITYIAPKRTKKEPIEILFTNPAAFKYLIFGLFWSMVTFWALKEIIDMVSFLINLLRSN